MSPVFMCLVGMAVVVGAILKFRLHPFLALMLGALVVGVLAPGEASFAGVGKRLAEAFGTGCGKVGLVIAMAAVIGQCLLVSGAAERIVRGFLSLFGVKRAPLGFLSSGFLLGIPVFFDTVFYLMVPLVRTFAKSNPEKFILALLAVVAGGSMAHSLVPPTPGPITVVENLNQTLEATGQQELDLGIMIAGGLLLGVITILVGYLYALWANRVFRIPMRRTAMSELTEFEPDPERRLPPLSAAILPVVIPFLLIMIGTIVTSLWGKSTDTDYPLAGQIVLMLGDKHAALAVGALVAVVLALRYRPAGMELPKVIQSAPKEYQIDAETCQDPQNDARRQQDYFFYRFWTESWYPRDSISGPISDKMLQKNLLEIDSGKVSTNYEKIMEKLTKMRPKSSTNA